MTTSPQPPPSVPPRRRRWGWRRAIGLAFGAWFLALLIDHRGTIQWVRPPTEVQTRRAYVHIEDGRTRLSQVAQGNCGIVTYSRLRESIDDRLLATDILEWRHLAVIVDGRVLSAQETDQWRPAAAREFSAPEILRGDLDDTRRFWLGYPLELLGTLIGVPLSWLMQLTSVLAIVLAPALLVFLLLRGLRDFLDPQARRARALQNGRCPGCGYSLFGLTLNRCPECGERWLASEVKPQSHGVPL